MKSPIFLNLIVLDLSNTNLSGINDVLALCIASQEGKLRELQTLNLSKNNLTGSLGVLLANEFKSLQTLLLEDTKLSVSDVRALSIAAMKIKFLETLNLSKNNLTGSLGVLLVNEFKCLQTLLLEDTNLSVCDVQALSTADRVGKLQILKTLDLSKNILTDTIDDLLKGGFRSLKTLLLEDTKLIGSDVQALSKAAREDFFMLRMLNLSEIYLTDTVGDTFALSETVVLEDTKLSASDMKALSAAREAGKLPRLETLNLSKNILTGTLHDLLKGNFRLLETLLLENTKLSVSDVRALSTAVQTGKLQWLETLDLSKNILTDAMCDLVKCRFYNLKELLLEDTKLSISDVRALSMASWLSTLKTLNLSENILRESLVLFLDNEMPSLETLLLENTVLSTRDILALSTAVRARKLPVLQYLNISQQNACNLQLPVINLIRRCATDIQKKIQVNISLTSYGREFQQDVRSICEESKVNVF